MAAAGSGRGRVERDTCRDVVLPALGDSGWEPAQIVGEYPVKADRVISAGGQARELPHGRVDYVLEVTPGVPVAVIEAKREYREASEGFQQAIRYAQQLDVPVAFSTNGRSIIERDLLTGRERTLDSFPTPPELWDRYCAAMDLSPEQAAVLRQPFNRNRRDASDAVITARFYQTVAIHRVLKGIMGGDRRILLLMATGTGKTFTAMQIVAKWRSWQRAVAPDANLRVLYLADRDALLTQPMGKDFVPAFSADAVIRVQGATRMGREVFFASYQSLSAGGAEQQLFRDYPESFFDLVIVDECHRGSAAAGSSWRSVLDHFAPAVQLGLTATPLKSGNVDTYEYFGNPVYEYSLRQGIEDGYLAPYRVRRVVLSPDAKGWSPAPGEVDRYGQDIPEGLYSTRDFERIVSLLPRTRLAARHLSGILRANPRARAIVFCVDIEHAEQMRAAIAAENPDLLADDPEWVVRIVGVENEKTRLLDQFTDPESGSPVVVTTSKLLSTGIDVEDLRYVVLFRPVGSMVEFKQIIGRGTRLYPAGGKRFFEIVDYVGATQLFQDPAFDGPPQQTRVETIDAEGRVVGAVQVDPEDGSRVDCPSFPAGPPGGSHPELREPEPDFTVGGSSVDGREVVNRRKLYVDDGVVWQVAEGHLVPDTSTGRLRLVEYGEYVAGEVRSLFRSPDELTGGWAVSASREEITARLGEHGIELEEIAEAAGMEAADPVDVLIFLAWNVNPPTRAERARRVREGHATDIERLSEPARKVLSALLERYVLHGVGDVTSGEVLSLPPIADLGTPVEIAAGFGGPEQFHAQVDRLQRWLYSA